MRSASAAGELARACASISISSPRRSASEASFERRAQRAPPARRGTRRPPARAGCASERCRSRRLAATCEPRSHRGSSPSRAVGDHQQRRRPCATVSPSATKRALDHAGLRSHGPSHEPAVGVRKPVTRALLFDSPQTRNATIANAISPAAAVSSTAGDRADEDDGAEPGRCVRVARLRAEEGCGHVSGSGSRRGKPDVDRKRDRGEREAGEVEATSRAMRRRRLRATSACRRWPKQRPGHEEVVDRVAEDRCPQRSGAAQRQT